MSSVFRPQGHLLGQSETNPNGQMNAITLTSGRVLEEPETVEGENNSEVEGVTGENELFPKIPRGEEEVKDP